MFLLAVRPIHIVHKWLGWHSKVLTPDLLMPLRRMQSLKTAFVHIAIAEPAYDLPGLSTQEYTEGWAIGVVYWATAMKSDGQLLKQCNVLDRQSPCLH